MHRVDDPTAVDALLRHPALRDRAVFEETLTSYFFAPFIHQEAVRGERFEARLGWSRAALGGVPTETAVEVANRAFERHARPGLYPSLLAEVRRVSAAAACVLSLGDLSPGDWADEELVHAVVLDFDEYIKMMRRPNLPLRRSLRPVLERRLADPERWIGTSYLSVAKEQALALPLGERVDHLASVFLGTGTIQVSDVVTHALIAELPLAEAIQAYPVNSSLTREVAADVHVDGARYRRGDEIHVYPTRVNQAGGAWDFGVGPRACPARRVALALCETLLERFRALGVSIEPGYEHRRSLAMPVRARLGPGPAPEPAGWWSRSGAWARYLECCAVTYPQTLVVSAYRASQRTLRSRLAADSPADR